MRRTSFVLLLLASTFTAQEAAAHHFNRGHFVPAFRPCAEADANTATSQGVAACSPARRYADCESDPLTALRIGSSWKSSYNMEPKGRRRTRENGGLVDMDSAVGLSDVQRCNGIRYTGLLQVEVVIRMQRDDEDCNTGRCTLPDITYHHLLPCERGRCDMEIEGINEQLVEQGLPQLPSDHTYRMSVVRMSILDLAGRPMLNVGTAVSGEVIDEMATASSLRSSWSALVARAFESLLPSDAEAYGSTGIGSARRNSARLVQAFAPCDPGATDTLTSDGLAACTTALLSDCAVDSNAVVPDIPATGNFTDDGKGKLDYSIVGDPDAPLLRVRGWLTGLRNCSGDLYQGPVGVRAIVRATLLDPACAGGLCTTVDTPLFTGVVQAVDGEVDGKQFRSLRLEFPPGAEGTSSLNAEVVAVELLDAAGRPFMVGPSWLVRCNFDSTNPNQPGGDAFCFGN